MAIKSFKKTTKKLINYTHKNRIHMYYCMTIHGNIPFKIYHIGPTEGRDDTEVENRIFPRIA